MLKSLKILSLKILKVLKWWLNVFPQEKKENRPRWFYPKFYLIFKRRRG